MMKGFSAVRIFFAFLLVFFILVMTPSVISHLTILPFGFSQADIETLTYLFMAFIIGVIMIFILWF